MRQIKLFGVAWLLLSVAVVFSQVPATAQAQMPAGVHEMKVASGGMVLSDVKGMTLYTFAKDMPDMSNCYDNCAKNWPPLMAATDAKAMGDWTVVKRKDNTMQWAHKGMPLYTWIKDMKPGETTGDGMANGAWKVAAP
jgi:predicted lipoprotein with Yx(FWY)xxD motif